MGPRCCHSVDAADSVIRAFRRRYALDHIKYGVAATDWPSLIVLPRFRWGMSRAESVRNGHESRRLGREKAEGSRASGGGRAHGGGTTARVEAMKSACDNRGRRIRVFFGLSVFLIGGWVGSPSLGGDRGQRREAEAIAERPTLYVTGTAHLDTQWLWTIQKTIDEYIPSTLRGNFERFEESADYIFSFEGAFRYQLAKEYYPDEYARMKAYIKEGRWKVCGSMVDACDVNVPSPESLIRQVLYGNGFFDREFGQRSVDIYLPDCFGFGYALPSVAAHCGLKGFSTQKLTWGSSIGIPFDVGVWEGVDGTSVVAALNPGAYVSRIRDDLSRDSVWLERIKKLGVETGVSVGYKYFGVGDIGGAPDAESVRWLDKAIHGDGPLRVILAGADQLYRDLTAEQVRRLPRYKGEMLMTRHGTGCYTSQTAMKRWNRKNELLADAAERASVVADWLGGATYPRDQLEGAWVRFLWHQFHDDLTGTSIPQAYTFSWNDELISLNRFSSVLTDSVGAVARALDTRGSGRSLVVFNPLAFAREDVVSARLAYEGEVPSSVRVLDGSGREVPSQVTAVGERDVAFVFLARIPSVGFAVFDIQPAEAAYAGPSSLAVSESALENARYRLRLDERGDVASVFDKSLGRELLARPVRLELLRDTPDYWSEWEVRYEDVMAEPFGYVGGAASVSVVERGPVRATIEVTREAEGSTFKQRISLSGGEAGDRIEWSNRVNWRTPKTLLKARFDLAASNPTAVYDLGFGAIERGNNTETKYEVPAQQWADLTDKDGSYGATIFTDCKYGWDKPDDSTLRLTLIHTPNDIEKDMGWHQFSYGLSGHRGDWRSGDAVGQAGRVNQPMLAFETSSHRGSLGKQFSLLTVDDARVVVRAVKKAEASDEVVVRIQEAHGKPARDVRFTMAAPIVSARELNGQELPVGGEVAVSDGRLALDFSPYQPRTLGVKLEAPPERLSLPMSKPVALPFDLDGVSFDSNRSDGDFDGQGHTLPAELLSEVIVSGDVSFKLGSTRDGDANVVSCRGQTTALPKGDFDRVYVLAASSGDLMDGTFQIGDRAADVSVQGFSGWIGQWDSLVQGGRIYRGVNTAPGFVHHDEIAWVGTHRHDGAENRNEAYVFCYLFKYGFELRPGETTLTLPDDERIKVMAVTVARDENDHTRAASRHFDHSEATYIRPRGGLFVAPVTVTLGTDDREADIFYTLDGSSPTRASLKYVKPFRVARSMKVAARALRGGVLDEAIAHAHFTMTEARRPDEVERSVDGLSYRYYEGEWRKLPEFESLKAVKTGSTSDFTLAERRKDEHFGFVFTGFVEVPRDGVYTFYTASDDGSRLYIGDDLVVDNDGLHGKSEAFGEAGLKAGRHSVRVTFFERTGGDALEVWYEGPGIRKQRVPASALSTDVSLGGP